MEIDAALVGTKLKPYTTRITWRQTTNFAAAVEDPNPKYFDDTTESGIVAHPLFAVSVTWPVLSCLENYLDSPRFPKQVLMTQVHYTEHLVIHRLIEPGDELFLTGALAALLPHRAGTHAVIRLDARDKQGHPVFTEHIGAMLRGVDCGKGGKMDHLPSMVESDSQETALWRSPIHIDAVRPYIYDGCTQIEFPIHTSPKLARMVGLPGIILQGTATLAYAIRELVKKEADEDPTRIGEIACRFTGMVMPGKDIHVCCTHKKVHKAFTEVFFEVQNHEQQKAIRKGYVKIMNKGG